MKLKRSLIVGGDLLLCCAHGYAQAKGARASVHIAYHNRTIYFPGTHESEPIWVKVSLTNTGKDTLRFKLADDRTFSVDFSIRTMKNRALAHTDEWIRKRSTHRPVYFREISLEPGESYSFVENVKHYLDVQSAGLYFLTLLFYPELKRERTGDEDHLASNTLTLEVQPAPAAAALGALPVSPPVGEVLQPQRLSPDRVIEYVLNARQKSHWERFFLYLDLAKMLSRDAGRSRRFNAESEAGRYNMIDTYKHELRQERVDKDIAAIPVEFRIEKTVYTATDAEVRVLEWFEYRDFREKKRFTYHLSSRDGIWYVHDYVVENLGTE